MPYLLLLRVLVTFILAPCKYLDEHYLLNSLENLTLIPKGSNC